jgi:hypothetical protein
MQNRYALIGLLPMAMAAFAQDSIQTTGTVWSAFAGSAHFAAADAIHGGVKGAPYSADETDITVQTLADGTHITRENGKRKVYRDSAGRTRVERPLMAGIARRQKAEAPVIVEIVDPVEHVKYTLDTANKIAHKQAVAAPERERAVKRTAPRADAAAAPKQPAGEDAPQTTFEKLDPQTIEGLQLEGNRHSVIYPAGYDGNDQPIKEVDESWWSPELKVTVLSTRNTPAVETTHTNSSTSCAASPIPLFSRRPPITL